MIFRSPCNMPAADDMMHNDNDDEDEQLLNLFTFRNLPFHFCQMNSIRDHLIHLCSSYNELHSSDFGECPRNHFTAFLGSRLPIIWVKKDKQRSIKGNTPSQLDNNELHWSNRNIPRDPEFQHDYTYQYNQHIRKEIVRRSSSFIVSTVVFIGILYSIWNSSLSSIIKVPALNKERDVSILPSLLGLFGFMVFVCSVAVMILVGAPFNTMQKAMLIFWAILMHLQSANSISEVYLTLVGGLFMVWYTFCKKQPPNDVMM